MPLAVRAALWAHWEGAELFASRRRVERRRCSKQVTRRKQSALNATLLFPPRREASRGPKLASIVVFSHEVNTKPLQNPLANRNKIDRRIDTLLISRRNGHFTAA